jgi:hypothetical protein
MHTLSKDLPLLGNKRRSMENSSIYHDGVEVQEVLLIGPPV